MEEARVLYGGGSCTVWRRLVYILYGGGSRAVREACFCMAEANGGWGFPPSLL